MTFIILSLSRTHSFPAGAGKGGEKRGASGPATRCPRWKRQRVAAGRWEEIRDPGPGRHRRQGEDAEVERKEGSNEGPSQRLEGKEKGPEEEKR